ncbi:MAG: YceI family protein, partial [Zetaproteobacteria bacterium]|nr:YceI family protein [Zetaproteobacteria bacterium]
MKLKVGLLCLFVNILSIYPLFGAAREYVLDTAHSSVLFEVKHLKFATVSGLFKSWEGQFEYDADKKVITDLVIKFDVDTISTHNDDRDAHLKSTDFFGVRDKRGSLIAKNQYIVFRGEKFVFTKEKL